MPAVIDTSFWIAGYRAEVIANCLDLFDIMVPDAVEVEIRGPSGPDTPLEYPYATLFRHLRGQLQSPPADAPARLPILGAGEAEAIALAQHLRVALLVNERRAVAYATGQGIPIVTVPGVIVVLCRTGVISDRAARTKLALLESITTARFIEDARRALDGL